MRSGRGRKVLEYRFIGRHAPTSDANFARIDVAARDDGDDLAATPAALTARPLSAAAIAQPAAPSAMTCARSATSFIARATSSSETTIDPDSGESSGHIVGSTDLPPAPSTNDAVQSSKYTGRPGGERRRQRRGRLRLGGVDARAAASARATAAAMPASRPPPPSGATIASTSGRSSRISSADRGVAGDEPIVVERMHEVAASCDRSRATRPSASIRRRSRGRSTRRAARWRGSSCRAPCPSP